MFPPILISTSIRAITIIKSPQIIILMSSEQISENEFEIHSRLCSLMSREQYGGYDPQQIG